jgi:anaerobic selenocysteine-containing dehydrogenase
LLVCEAGTSKTIRILQLQAARERGVPIITFNPLRERGLERFTNPQSPLEMLTQISTQYHQLNPGGDLAALVGMSKALLDMDDAGKNNGGGRALDIDFINQQTSGFEDFVDAMNLFQWGDIEACTGPTR